MTEETKVTARCMDWVNTCQRPSLQVEIAARSCERLLGAVDVDGFEEARPLTLAAAGGGWLHAYEDAQFGLLFEKKLGPEGSRRTSSRRRHQMLRLAPRGLFVIPESPGFTDSLLKRSPRCQTETICATPRTDRDRSSGSSDSTFVRGHTWDSFGRPLT